jgi:hypothetical protein
MINIPPIILMCIQNVVMKLKVLLKNLKWHNDHYKTVGILFFFAFSLNGYGQNLAELEKRNGFKDIKLGTTADSIKGIKFKKEFLERDEFPAKLYTVEHPDYAKIGEVNIDKIELKTYDDLIYEIIVITHKDLRMMKALESLYGKSDYDIKRETYFWKSESLILKFRSHSKNRLELLYISYPVLRKMKEDKNQKVDDIANDF